MGFYLGYLEVAGLMQKTSGLSCGVVVVQGDFTCERLIADGADSTLSVVEELPDVFLCLVVHIAPLGLGLKVDFATNSPITM